MKKQVSEGFIFLPRRIGRFALGEGTGLIPCKAHRGTDSVISNADLFAEEAALERKLSEKTISAEGQAWRRLLCILLLWDAWEPEADTALRVHDFDEKSSLASAVLRTADASRRQEGLRVLCLHQGEKIIPMGMGSRRTLVVPLPLAENVHLPAMAARLLHDDPCLQMNDAERALAASRLRLLLTHTEGKSAAVALKSFLKDLQQKDEAERQAIVSGEEAAGTSMLTRVKAVCGLQGEPNFEAMTCREEKLQTGTDTLFFQCFGMHDEARKEATVTRKIFCWKGQPFARESGTLGLESTGAENETSALAELAEAMCLLEANAPAWQKHLAEKMQMWLANLPDSACAEVREAGHTAADEAEIASRRAETPLHLDIDAQPMDSPAVRWLFEHALGKNMAQADVFPQGLLMLPSDAVEDGALRALCAVRNTMDALALLPMTMDCADALEKESAQARWILEQSAVTYTGAEHIALMTLAGRQNVALEKHYGEEDVLHLRHEEVPTAAVWPGVSLPENTWKYYVTFVHVPQAEEGLDVTVKLYADGAWQEGETQNSQKEDNWWMLRTKQRPSLFVVQINGHDLGVLPCMQEKPIIPAGAEVTAAVDMGASGTSILLKQGEHFLNPQETPTMKLFMLGIGSEQAAQMLPPIPMQAAMPSVEEIVSAGDAALEAGHILRQGKPSATAVFGLKWGTPGTAIGTAQRMYLKQLMLEACLTSALHGAPSIRWRFSVPCGMAPGGRKSWQTTVLDLAKETALDTGLKVAEVSFAEEHQAEQTYFREIGGIRGGMMTLDVGGSSAEIALWLHGMSQPAMNCSLPMGVQMMLLQDLSSRTELLRADLPEGQEQLQCALTDLAEQLSQGLTSVKMVQQSQMALDIFMRDNGMAVMQASPNESDGRSLLRTTLLTHYAFLMTLVGLMQEQAFQDSTLNDRLPPYMELCLAGRGAAYLQGLDAMTRQKLTMFIRLCMSPDHPTREHPLVFSQNPKQEITLGMLRMKRMAETVPDAPEIRGTDVAPELSAALVLERFLLQMHATFPQEASTAFGQTVENGHVTEQTKRAIDRAAEIGEKLDAPLPVQCAAAFASLKQHFRTVRE